MSLYDCSINKYKETEFFLGKLIEGRKDGSWGDRIGIEAEAARLISRGFYLVRFDLRVVVEGGVVPFFIEEDDILEGIAYVFVRNSGMYVPAGGNVYEAEDGKKIRTDYWGDTLEIMD